MKQNRLSLLIFGLMVVSVTQASESMDKDAKIQNAMSSAPISLAAKATIMDWPKEGEEAPTLRKGSNGWTCFPDMPQTPGNDPMCLDDAWMAWADAWMNKKPLKNTKMGFGYMLQQNNSGESNIDPYASGPTPDNEWMKEGVPHLMILVQDEKMLQGLPTDHSNGDPWVMWRNTPYVHVMAPMPLNKE